MTDAFTVEYTVERGTRRRVRYESRSGTDGWWRIEDEHTGCRWRTIGREHVSDVAVEPTGSVLTA